MFTSHKSFVIATLLLGCWLPAACSSSSSSTAQPAAKSSAATGGTPSPSRTKSTAPAGDLSTKGCSAIKLADVQAVVKATVTKVDFTPGDAELDPTHSFRCDVNNPTLLIDIHPEDASKATYTQDVAAENVPAVALSGVGDVAVWTAVSLTPGTYTGAPDVYAHKGSITCEITGSGQDLTVPVGSGLAGGICQGRRRCFRCETGSALQ